MTNTFQLWATHNLLQSSFFLRIQFSRNRIVALANILLAVYTNASFLPLRYIVVVYIPCKEKLIFEGNTFCPQILRSLIF